MSRMSERKTSAPDILFASELASVREFFKSKFGESWQEEFEWTFAAYIKSLDENDSELSDRMDKDPDYDNLLADFHPELGLGEHGGERTALSIFRTYVEKVRDNDKI